MGPRSRQDCNPDWTVESGSAEATEALAASLAQRIEGGEVILLRGPLGAGKTLFAGALAQALGASEPVTSPSFVILRSYPVRDALTFHHLDFYRLAGDDDLRDLGVEELVGEDSLVVVEWPERCPNAFPSHTLRIDIHVVNDESRRIEGRWGDRPLKPNGWPVRETS